MKDAVHPPSNRKGFSMLELLVVLAIIGILIVIAISFFSDMDQERLKTALRDVVSRMQMARTNAFEEGETWAVQFDTGANPGYRLLAGWGADQTWNTADDIEFLSVPLSEFQGVSFGSGQGAHPDDPGEADITDGCSMPGNRVIFNADGTTNYADGTSSQGMVYLMTDTGDTVAIGMLSAAGLVKSWKHFGDGWRDR